MGFEKVSRNAKPHLKVTSMGVIDCEPAAGFSSAANALRRFAYRSIVNISLQRHTMVRKCPIDSHYVMFKKL